MESVRHGSEIRESQTGRSLRTTEQDIIDSESYVVKDDDFSMEYHRLVSHLQTKSVDFNRRLAAYLTTQVAKRSEMERVVTNSYDQHQKPSVKYPQQRPFAITEVKEYTPEEFLALPDDPQQW